jgi:uncharacterized protein YcbX
VNAPTSPEDTAVAGIGVVAGLWRYPVSSLAGAPEEMLTIGTGGVDGDRIYGLVDRRDGEICRPAGVEAKWQPAPRIRSRLGSGGTLETAVPDGPWIEAPGSGADAAVSDYLGFPASIRPMRKAVGTSHTGPVTIARYVEAPVHLLTSASLDELKRLHPSGDPDPRRFRPNLLVSMPAMPGHFPETEWIGRRIAVGEVELTISEPCRRCGFTVAAQEGLAFDPAILRTLVRFNAHNLGVYCTVEQAGSIRQGDTVRFLD